MGNRRKKIKEKDLQGFKYFKVLSSLLETLHDAGCARDIAGNRKLHMDQYVSLLLLYMFNPICTSLRSIQQASELKKVQKIFGASRASMGSLSEASTVFDSELLKNIRIIAVKCNPKPQSCRSGGRGGPKQGQIILIATDRMDLEPETIAAIYEHRWTIEIYFRFFKHILGCHHLLSHKQNGIELQMYAAIIACMLMALWTGKKPTLRTYEMVCWHFTGMADEEELLAHMARLKIQS